jgi:hypothetical protein
MGMVKITVEFSWAVLALLFLGLIVTGLYLLATLQ